VRWETAPDGAALARFRRAPAGRGDPAPPSFIEAAVLGRLGAALQRTRMPETWRRETARAVSLLRPEVLILSPAAAGLRAAWALAQVSGPAGLCGLRWDESGRPRAKCGAAPALQFQGRELAPGMGGGLLGALKQALAAAPDTPGLIVFFSAGWGAEALAAAAHDTAVRARAAQWRRCYLFANGRCLSLHPRSRLPVQA
jgi:hypothetical protein